MGLFSKSVNPAIDLRLEDVIPKYDRRMYHIINIGKCLYKGYLPDSALSFGEFAYLRGFHDYQIYTKKLNGKKKRRKTLQVPKFTTEYLNKLIYTEKVSTVVESESNPKAAANIKEYLDEVLEDNDYWNNSAELAETMWNMGGKVEKPTIKNSKLHIEFVTAERFYPVEWDNKNVHSGLFVTNFQLKGYYYTKLTWYEKKDVDYEIRRELYKSKDAIKLGQKISYKTLYDDAETYTLTNFKAVPFTYCKPRIKNNQSLNSPLGLPIWFNAIDTIADLDLTFDTKFREVRYGGRQKVVPSYALKRKIRKESDGTKSFETFYDPDDETIQAYNLDPNNKDGVKDLTSPIRDASFINLLNQSLDILAIQMGYSSGTFHFNGTSMKTATEVMTEKESTFQTKVNNEQNLGIAHQNLFLSIIELASAFELDTRVNIIPDDIKFVIKFDDSVIIDNEKLLGDMKADANDEYIERWQYTAAKYKLSEEDAKKMVAKAKASGDLSALLGIESLDDDLDNAT